MFTKLRDLWKLATDAFREKHSYVVYTPRKDLYAGFKLKEDYPDRILHRAIAKRENNHPQRETSGNIQPGSFNFVRVHDCVDMHQAVEKAKAQGLRHEPISVVLARYKNEARERVKQSNISLDQAREFEAMLKKFSDYAPKSP